MELAQTLRQTTRLAMTQRMQQSLQVLQMSTAELCQYLEEKAEETPHLQVRLPRARPRDLSPRPDMGYGWDATDRLVAEGPGLFAHVAAQIDARFDNPRERQVAGAFLDALEPSGWLSQPLEAVALAASVPTPVAAKVLAELQQFDPSGVFARSLSECLRIQAADEGVLTWELETFIEHLPLFADGRLAELAEICDCEPEDIPKIATLLRGFDPKPGLRFGNDLPPIFPPDLSVRRNGRGWEVELTRSNLPTLSVASDTGGEDGGAVAAAQAEAQALMSALEKRQATMLRVGAVLVRHQEGFLDNGPGHLKPLTLEMVAEELELHASTISRVCAGRMIAGPRGAFPLKALFSRPVDAGTGPLAVSQDQLSEKLAQLIASEPAAKPLSDATLADKLAEEGFVVARRTVAKYREALGIPPSARRKRDA